MKKTCPDAKLLALRSYKANKGRNLVAIVAIVLTTLMFAALFVLSQSMSKNMVEMAFRQTGYNAHVSFKGITDEQIKMIAAHPDIKEVGRSVFIGLAENTALSGRQVEIRYGSDPYAERSFSAVTTGKAPVSADEIALDDITLDRLGIPHELGQPVTLEWRKGQDVITSEFILCGFWKGNSSSYASKAWVSEEFAAAACGEAIYSDPSFTPDSRSELNLLGLRMAQVMFDSEEGLEEAMDAVLADIGLTGLEYNINLAYRKDGGFVSNETLLMYGGMILVFIAGYLIIYNIFQISVVTDIHFYGQLKTLGASARHIRSILYGQSLRLSLIGIPIGLILGYFIGAALVPALLGTMDDPSISVSPVIFIGTILFALLTVLISCLRPARVAARVSPMEALRYSDAPSGTGRKTKKSKDGASVFRMAWANLGRNKKRTAVVICSLTLGLVLLTVFYAQNASFDMEKYLSDLAIADFEVADASSEDYVNGYNPYGTTLRPELMEQINALPGLEATGRMYSSATSVVLSDNAFRNMQTYYEKNDRLSYMEFDVAWMDGYDKTIAFGVTDAVIFGCDGLTWDMLGDSLNLMDGTFDPEVFAKGQHVMAIGVSTEDFSEAMPTFSVGEEVEINGIAYTIMGIVQPISPITGGISPFGFSLDFIMPAEAFQRQWPDNTLRKFYFNVSDDQTEAAQSILTDYQQRVDSSMPIRSRSSIIEQYEAETRASGVMGSTISIVIALVGVLNFVNSMVTAIISRRREFAMLQSVGMTKRQLRGMLIFEGLDYAALTLAFAYTVGTVIVGTVVRAIVEGGFTTFQFTLLPLIVCTPVLLAFAVVIPFCCFKDLEKQSLVERLRNTD